MTADIYSYDGDIGVRIDGADADVNGLYIKTGGCAYRGVVIRAQDAPLTVEAHDEPFPPGVPDPSVYRGIEVTNLVDFVADLLLENCSTRWEGPPVGSSGIVVEAVDATSISRVRVSKCAALGGSTGIAFLYTNPGAVFAGNRVSECYSSAATPYAFDPGTVELEHDNLPGTGAAPATTSLIWAPNFPGGSAGNIYDNWADAYAAMAAQPAHNRELLVMDVWAPATVDTGTWYVAGWTFRGYGSTPRVSADWDTYFDIETFPSNGERARTLEFADFQRVTFSSGTGAQLYAADASVRVRFTRVDEVRNFDGPWLDDQGGCTVVFDDSELYSPDAGFITGVGGTTVEMKNRSFYSYGQLADATLLNPVSVTYDVASRYVTPYPDEALVAARRDTLPLYALPGAINARVVADVGTPEVTIGGFIFDPTGAHDSVSSSITFEVLLSSAAATARVRLYEIGDINAGFAAPVLRGTFDVTPSFGSYQEVLTPTASPGVDAYEIMRAPGYADFASTAQRYYEIRVTADAVEDIYVYWAGLKIQYAFNLA